MAGFGLALSGGGAAGFGHIVALEALDELGARPEAIAGTSVGAMIGAAYANGMTGAEMRAHILGMVDAPFAAIRTFWAAHQAAGAGIFSPVPPRAAVETVLPEGLPARLEDLAIPLSVVATDLGTRESVVFTAGDLRDCLAASAAIPGVFAPMEIDGRFLIDGGVLNNLPYDCLPSGLARVAFDVASEPPVPHEAPPGALDVAAGAMRIMMQALLDAKLAEDMPDVLIRPGSNMFGVFDVLEAEEIFAAAAPAREAVKRDMAAILNRV